MNTKPSENRNFQNGYSKKKRGGGGFNMSLPETLNKIPPKKQNIRNIKTKQNSCITSYIPEGNTDASHWNDNSFVSSTNMCSFIGI